MGRPPRSMSYLAGVSMIWPIAVQWDVVVFVHIRNVIAIIVIFIRTLFKERVM